MPLAALLHHQVTIANQELPVSSGAATGAEDAAAAQRRLYSKWSSKLQGAVPCLLVPGSLLQTAVMPAFSRQHVLDTSRWRCPWQCMQWLVHQEIIITIDTCMGSHILSSGAIVHGLS